MCIRDSAYTDYLMAVLGARTNNSSMVTSSLKSAVAKEPALAKKAETDLEDVYKRQSQYNPVSRPRRTSIRE